MVYVYAKQSELNKYIGEKLSVEDIKDTLMDLGMDVKGETDETNPELKIEITAEKIDLVSKVGIARAIKYYRGITTEFPSYTLGPAKEKVIAKKSSKDARHATVAVILRNFKLDEEKLLEIIDIQEKMHASFGRNRKKASIGIYPLEKIQFPVTYGFEKPEDIVFKALDMDKELNGKEILEQHDKGRKYAHLLEGQKLFPIFRDSRGHVLSMPPIINSEEMGKVTINDTDLFLEVSGKNLHHLDLILKVLVTTFIEMGAQAEAVTVEYEDTDDYVFSLEPQEDTLSLGFINKLIGISIKENVAKELLQKMMYGVKSAKYGELIVEIPAFRGDVWHDVDIADDVARAYGYNNIVPRFPGIATVGKQLPYSAFRDRVTQTIVNLGFLELYTYILSSSQEQYTMMNKEVEEGKFLRLIDSTDEGINMCRTWIIPELLKSLRINRKNKYPQKVFENGFTLQVSDSGDVGARDEAHVAVALADPKTNYTHIKGALDAFATLSGFNLEFKDAHYSSFIEGRVAEIFFKGESVGVIGEIHPQVLENYSLLVPVAAFELNLEKIWELSHN